MDMNDNPQALLTKKEVADQLNVCVRTVENLMRTKRLTYIKMPKTVRIKQSSVTELIENFTCKASI